MASNGTEQLIRALRYEPNRDIINGTFLQVQKYILSISAATARFQELIGKLLGSMRKLTKTENLLLLSTKHHLRMFREIISAVQDPSDKALRTLSEVTKFEQKVDELSAGDVGDDPGGQEGVPSLTPYELSINVVIDRVEMIRESLAPKKRLEEIIEQLSFIMRQEGEKETRWGRPLTVAFGIKAEGTGPVSVATSKDVWPPKSFLKAWVVEARKARFGDQGSRASKTLIEEVNETVRALAMADEISEKQAVLDLASAEYACKHLNDLYAQAFDAGNFNVRDRCWRCRITFGFKWLWCESNPTNATSKDVRDFEGLWGENSVQTQSCEHGGSLEGGNANWGMCAEYLLWWEQKGRVEV